MILIILFIYYGQYKSAGAKVNLEYGGNDDVFHIVSIYHRITQPSKDLYLKVYCNQDLRHTFSICVCQSFINKVGSFLKEGTEVKLFRVIGLYTMVCDPTSCIELSVGVHVHEGVALCGVQNVCDAEPLQTHHILRHKPDEQKDNSHEFHLNHRPSVSADTANFNICQPCPLKNKTTLFFPFHEH